MRLKHDPSARAARLLALGAVFACGIAQAVTTVTLTPSATSVSLNAVDAQVTITAIISDVTAPTDRIVFHDFFLAYDPSVLTVKSVSGFNWGDNTLNPQPVANPIAAQTSGGDSSYASIGTGLNGLGSFSLGTVGALTGKGSTGLSDDYRPGSIRLTQDLNDDLTFNNVADQNGKSLFQIIFDVTTSSIATSSIVLVDQRYYTGAPGLDLDWKLGDDDPTVIIVNNAEISVPVPAPLALMALGLLGLGALRRQRAGRV